MDVENKCMDTKGEKGRGVMNWKVEIDVYIYKYILLILCIKQTTENLLSSSENSTQCFVRVCAN